MEGGLKRKNSWGVMYMGGILPRKTPLFKWKRAGGGKKKRGKEKRKRGGQKYSATVYN